jgi:ATP-dependent helicase HrpB
MLRFSSPFAERPYRPSLSSSRFLPAIVLPIEPVLPDLVATMRRHTRVVLEAPPGAGKTTRVPLALLGERWLEGQRIVMLEPRRLAARQAARRMSTIHGDDVGGVVGYRVRLESRVSARTRIEVVTEGILTRMLQDDPSLAGIGVLIFDEFHERNLPSDLGLALALEVQEAFRPDLRLLVMSATLDGARVGGLLGNAPVVRSEGRAYPVATIYLERPLDGRIEDEVARTVRRALAETDGDVLVFLPGTAEIQRTKERLTGLPAGVDVLPLFGALPPEAQDRAITPAEAGRRKVVLSTDIAETSLTIEGVRTVIDSGLARRPRFDPVSGMDRLETVRIARSSADQRRGRAGRLGPGACYRLWTAFEDRHLAPFSPPEIATADLAPLALELAGWGAADPDVLRWLDPPPHAAYAGARELLAELGALDRHGAITPHGRRMIGLGIHPRLAHLVLRSADLGLGATACRLAALLAERDVLRMPGPVPPPSDLRLRLDLLGGHQTPSFWHGVSVDRGAVARARDDARRLQQRLRIDRDAADAEAAGLLLALAYPDRIAQRREGSDTRYRLRNGQAAALADSDPLVGSDFLAAAHLGGRGAEARIFLAAPLTRADLETHFADQIDTTEEVVWDAASGTVRARRQTRLGAVVLRETSLPHPEPDAVASALFEGIRTSGLEVLPWSRETRRLRERLAFMHHLDPDQWPAVSDAALLHAGDQWLLPFLSGMRRLDDLRRLDLTEALLSPLPWSRRAELDRLAPTHIDVPSGSRIPIDYRDPTAPVLAVRLQEVFGLQETPRVAGGRVPLTVQLLSPAHRPVQVTQDLASFWREAYFDVRKDLRGRYPKHYWPDDPLVATPTRRVRPR